MAYLSLYRKWRPQAFLEVVGQEHIVRTLTNALETGRVAHAYLFSGPRGTGKTTFARLLAKGLNCVQGPTGSPCNNCENCRRITGGSSVDVIEIDGASNRGIDEIRELRDRVKYAPTECKFKVYIIDEVHMLTNEAFNALLKVLEEPPAHVIFVFATTEAHKVPATILSRCQKFDFRRFKPVQLCTQLEKIAKAEGVEADPAALALIARHAEGGMRDALGILDQCLAANAQLLTVKSVSDVLGIVRREALTELAGYIITNNVSGGLQLIHSQLDEGVEARQLLKDLASYMRDLVLIKAAPQIPDLVAYEGADRELLQAQAAQASLNQLLAAVEVLASAENEMRWSTNPTLAVELVMVQAMTTETASRGTVSTETIPAWAKLLEQRIIRIENSLRTKQEVGNASVGALNKTLSSEDGLKPTSQTTTNQPSTDNHVRKEDALSTEGTTSEKVEASAPPVVSDQVLHSAADSDVLPTTQETTPSADLDMLGKLQAAWTTVLSSLKEERLVSLEAFLRVGTPGEIHGRTVVIYFSPGHKFHQANIENARNKGLIERVISRVLGQDVLINTAVGNPPPPPVVNAGGVEQKSATRESSNVTPSGAIEQAASTDEIPLHQDGIVQTPAVQKALRYLGGRVVEVFEN